MAYDLTLPETWPPRLRRMAWEAMKNPRLHHMRAKRLFEAGIAAEMSDGRCVVKLKAHEALHKMMRSNARVKAAAEGSPATEGSEP